MSKRPLDIDTAPTTPSKKATVRRGQNFNKRSSEEVVSDVTTTGKKKARHQDSVEEGEKTAKKNPARRNTERLSSLLEKNNIIASPTAANRSSSFTELDDDIDELSVEVPVSTKKPRSRKSLSSNAQEVSKEVVLERKIKVEVAKESEQKPHLSFKSVATVVTAVNKLSHIEEKHNVHATMADYNSASLKVPSTQELRENDAETTFWSQCRETLSYCCACLYPAFLAVIVAAYALHFTTQQRVFASFAVVFTILSGIVLGFFFVAVIPFVVLTRTVERYLVEKDQPDSVFVNLLTRLLLLFVTFASLFVVQAVV